MSMNGGVNTEGRIGEDCECRENQCYNIHDFPPHLDFDECGNRTDNCSPFAACTNTEGGFECNCSQGFTGDGLICEGMYMCHSFRCG